MILGWTPFFTPFFTVFHGWAENHYFCRPNYVIILWFWQVFVKKGPKMAHFSQKRVIFDPKKGIFGPLLDHFWPGPDRFWKAKHQWWGSNRFFEKTVLKSKIKVVKNGVLFFSVFRRKKGDFSEKWVKSWSKKVKKSNTWLFFWIFQGREVDVKWPFFSRNFEKWTSFVSSWSIFGPGFGAFFEVLFRWFQMNIDLIILYYLMLVLWQRDA